MCKTSVWNRNVTSIDNEFVTTAHMTSCEYEKKFLCLVYCNMLLFLSFVVFYNKSTIIKGLGMV